MKNKLFYPLIVMLIALIMNSNAMASYSFNILTDYQAGDNQATFVLDFTTDETVAMYAYEIAMEYDQNELSFVNYSNTPFQGFFPNFPTPGFSADQGRIIGFRAGSFGYIQVNSGNYQLGSFTFDVASNASVDGEPDFNFDYDSNLFVFKVGDVEYNMHNKELLASVALASTIDVGTSAHVPVPSAIWLLGTGLVGLAGLRRKTA